MMAISTPEPLSALRNASVPSRTSPVAPALPIEPDSSIIKTSMNIIEAIRRKPLNQEIESYITLAGVAIMVVLMIAVTWNDIMRAFF